MKGSLKGVYKGGPIRVTIKGYYGGLIDGPSYLEWCSFKGFLKSVLQGLL